MNINKYIYFAIALIIILSPVSVNAITMTDADGVAYDETNTICTNEYYEYTTAYEKENFIFVNSDTNSIIHANTTYDGTISIPVANNISKVTLVEQELDEENKPVLSSEVRTVLNFTDCGNEVISEEQSYNNPTTKFEINGNEVTVINEYDGEIKLRYQFLNATTSEEIENGSVINAEGHDVIQLSEEYDGKTYYYEVYLNSEKNTYMVKDVDSFEVNRLALELINFKYVAISVVLLLLFIILTITYRVRKRKYNIAKSKFRSQQKRRGQ